MVWSMPVSKCLLVLAALSFPGLSQDLASICKSGTWSNCGIAVKQRLNNPPSDPKEIIPLAILWGDAFSRRFDALRKSGKIQSATPDSEKIRQAVEAKLDPVELAQDKVLDQLMKEYLPKVSAVLEWAEKPAAVFLKVFLSSSEIATDYDELRLMNDDIHSRIATLLQPHLKTNWKEVFSKAVTNASPQLIPAK